MNTKPASVALQTLRAGASALLPIYPETFDDVVRLARMAIISGMIKPTTKGWGDNQEIEPENATEARATMIIMGGMELGLPPMQAIQLIAMINGRMTVHSEGVPGLLLSKGFKIKQAFVGEAYEPTFAASCTITRPDGESNTTTFSVADAIEAGLWQTSPTVKKKGKHGTYDAPNDSPWWKYRKRMLWARALGFNSKDFASDAMKGLMVREEVEDMLRLSGGPIVDLTPDAVPTPAPSRRRAPTTEVPEVPDVPDPSIDQTPKPDGMPPEQERHYLDELKSELAAATPGLRMEIVDSYQAVIEEMSERGQAEARAIIEDGGE